MKLDGLFRALGLDPEFKGVPGAPPGRGFGTTVRMQVKAVQAALGGQRVRVAAHRSDYTKRLTVEVRRWVEQLGGDPTLVQPLFLGGDLDPRDKLRGYHGQVFMDHHVSEERTQRIMRHIEELRRQRRKERGHENND